MSFRIRAARRRRSPRALRHGQADRRRLHQPAARPDALEAKLERPRPGSRATARRRRRSVRVHARECRDRRRSAAPARSSAQVGTDRPFYSYRISTLTQKSEELGRIFRNQTLILTTDLEGSSEVGGLFLHPHERAGGLGMLLARSRYLFIKQHRPRFGAACWPSCAGSWTRPAIRRSGMRSPGASSA